MKKILTLCVVHDQERILLGLKKRGFGAGRWNGFGGKVEPGETIADAAARELREESGLKLRDLTPRGMLVFTFEDKPDELEVHIFSGRDYEGELMESDEMKPQWFGHAEIPYHAMWADDAHWLPRILAGRAVSGHFHFKDNDTLLSVKIEES